MAVGLTCMSVSGASSDETEDLDVGPSKAGTVKWSSLRGILLFFAGLTGETVLTVAWLKGTEPNQSLMLLFATMMGLPVFLQKDEDDKHRPPRDDGSQ
jgi:hypothetical protein